MRARGIVSQVGVEGGRACVFLSHVEDAESFKPADRLYTGEDVPELVALELKRRGKAEPVPGPFVISQAERNAMVDSRTYPAVVLVEAIERARRTLGQDSANTVHRIADLLGYVNRADGRSGYEQISDEKLIEEIQRTHQRCIELDEQILSWQNAHCIEADFEDESQHPLTNAIERKLAANVAPLSPGERGMMNSVRATLDARRDTDGWSLYESAVDGVLGIIERRLPEPKEKSPGQTLCEAMGTSAWQHADREFYERGAAAVLAAHGGKT